MSGQNLDENYRPVLATIIKVGLACLFAGLIIAILIPSPIGPRRSGPAWNAHICINNLRQIDAAACQFALEHNLTNGTPINFPDDLKAYLSKNSADKYLNCPSGGVYHISKVGEKPTCSLGTNVTPAHVLR